MLRFSAAWIATREAPAWTVNVPVTAPIMGQLVTRQQGRLRNLRLGWNGGRGSMIANSDNILIGIFIRENSLNDELNYSQFDGIT